MKCETCGVSSGWLPCGAGHSHNASDCPSFQQSQKGGYAMKGNPFLAMNEAWALLKQDDEQKAKQKIIACLKKEGGAASMDDCVKACGLPKEKCKKLIQSMDNVKISPHGDVILMDGL